jgi:hypothetical protein
MKIFVAGFAVTFALVSAASAQVASVAAGAFGAQNFDISLFCDVNRLPAQTIEGTGIALNAHTSIACFSHVIGYQVARPSGFGLWIELAPDYHAGGKAYGSIPGSASSAIDVHTLGLRLMVPLQSRISAYAAAGGGGGTFRYPTILPGSSPFILSRGTLRGVFDFGAGVDIRLSKRFSIRGDVRDFVTGRGLSGVSGTNHLLPLLGVAFHF